MQNHPRFALRLLSCGLLVGLCTTAIVWSTEPTAHALPPLNTDAAADDGMPRSSVAFFAGSQCPPGWVASDDTAGRLVVGVTDGAKTSVTVGVPLADQEDRLHGHTFTGSAELVPKALAAVDGANNNGAQAKTYPLMGSGASAKSGLPFAQLVICEKP